MNRFGFLTFLLLAVMITFSACGGEVSQSPAVEEPEVEAPVAEEPIAEEAVAEEPAEEPEAEAPAAEEPVEEEPTEAPTAQEPTQEPTEEPTRVPPAPEPPTSLAIPRQIKPPLAFSDSVAGINDQVIAYTFPADSDGWTIGIKAAPFDNIYSYPYGDQSIWPYMPVGLVEIGPGSDSVQAGIYLVTIELDSSESETIGEIVLIEDQSIALPVYFRVIPQVYNVERFETSYGEFNELDIRYENSVSISADSVCFVISSNDDPPYYRYCSEPGSLLSTMEIFGANYENLQGTIFEIAESFGLQNDIAYDQIISEKEDPGGIGTCRDVIMESAGEVEAILPFCGSDITVGPVKRDYYESAFEEARTDEPFWVTAAVVQILEPIDTESGPLPPGDYRMDYWFDENAEFYAATIIDQRGETWRVPAVPAALVNQDGSDQPGAQISTCQIFRKCTFFQRSCR